MIEKQTEYIHGLVSPLLVPENPALSPPRFKLISHNKVSRGKVGPQESGLLDYASAMWTSQSPNN